jgi:hypothetical protein
MVAEFVMPESQRAVHALLQKFAQVLELVR